ncbi:hypothetical protein K432DRAFT_377013 [Lepidopterella palustris CBS 459.81]|uniref:Tr-type G domain-containing protein n=1 Tax=Lepidopterella palustris CBS 459.81 TaxID=1314670 RepID=A0A8E2ELW4_9PEZI|nr:hypothetical protein K432DRAFT_377013 [Lepidopterella palustris CBS 459.81]
MASIFTFDPDPPRVSSPWSTPPSGSKPQSRIRQDSPLVHPPDGNGGQGASLSPAKSEQDVPVTRLEAEPQVGPTEYKLHLLLRRRRSFSRVSTGCNVPGSLRPRGDILTSPSTHRSVSDSNLSNTPPTLTPTQSRQHRLEQLTTQLLWRLQQSSQYHSSSAKNIILPHFPSESDLSTATVPRKLLAGLEDSKGALYEIGVADDGTFVGLADDEMEESLNNLRAMAASLGCCVDVLRMVAVGDCEWVEKADNSGVTQQKLRIGKLWVAEAFVRPNMDLLKPEVDNEVQEDSRLGSSNLKSVYLAPLTEASDFHSATDQLRVSLTGATMSGKSSLLGSLSTTTLDNGRGKSRLSLLKHRHEIASGMTSSVTQELIGYQDLTDQDGVVTSTQVINYASGNVSSWTDIHASSENGRLVFLSDSAGHPRYRRTTVRGLVGWAPHWTLLCIPADNEEETSGKIGGTQNSHDALGSTAADIDLSQAHLELCLNLDLPLVVVITKLDIATKTGLRQTLSRLLTALKAAGRKPSILSDTSTAVSEADLHTILPNDLLDARKTAETVSYSPLSTVPIVLTSAVRGTGISKLHALLRELPIPQTATRSDRDNLLDLTDAAPCVLFHVEEIYSTLSPSKSLSATDRGVDRGVVVGGHLRYGTLHVGDELLLGPYPVDASSDDSDSGTGRGSTSPPVRSHRSSLFPTSRSFPGALHKGTTSAFRPTQCGQDKHLEWRSVRIASLRNLRLPVRILHTGQVGTIGIVPLDQPIASPAVVRVRKGMVLADGAPKAMRVIEVRFTNKTVGGIKNLSVGTAVVMYVASVRASAKVLAVAVEDGQHQGSSVGTIHDDEADAFGFGFDDEDGDDSMNTDQGANEATIVTFQFIASREFVEFGAQALVVPGGGPGLYGGTERGEKGVAGLEGFVGRVVEGYG